MVSGKRTFNVFRIMNTFFFIFILRIFLPLGEKKKKSRRGGGGVKSPYPKIQSNGAAVLFFFFSYWRIYLYLAVCFSLLR